MRPHVRPSHGHTSSHTVAGVLGRWAVRPGTCKTPPCSPRRPHRLCGPARPQHTGYRGLLTSGIRRPGRWGVWAARCKARHMQDTFLLAKASTPAVWSSQAPAHWVSGLLTSGIKRPGRQAYPSLPASV